MILIRMIKDWFKTKYRIMPVYAENENKQVAVIVEVKYGSMQDFRPMAKTCLNDKGELTEKPAIFDNEEEAKLFIKHLKPHDEALLAE